MKCFEKCSYAKIEKHVFTMRELSWCEETCTLSENLSVMVPGWTQIKGSDKDTCTVDDWDET